MLHFFPFPRSFPPAATQVLHIVATGDGDASYCLMWTNAQSSCSCFPFGLKNKLINYELRTHVRLKQSWATEKCRIPGAASRCPSQRRGPCAWTQPHPPTMIICTRRLSTLHGNRLPVGSWWSLHQLTCTPSSVRWRRRTRPWGISVASTASVSFFLLSALRCLKTAIRRSGQAGAAVTPETKQAQAPQR